jgi:hypothetical protein
MSDAPAAPRQPRRPDHSPRHLLSDAAERKEMDPATRGLAGRRAPRVTYRLKATVAASIAGSVMVNQPATTQGPGPSSPWRSNCTLAPAGTVTRTDAATAHAQAVHASNARNRQPSGPEAQGPGPPSLEAASRKPARARPRTRSGPPP